MESPLPAVTAGAPALRSATIRSLGDFVIHDAIRRSAKVPDEDAYDFTDMFSMVSGVVGGADYTVANVDGSMGGPGEEGYAGYPRFNVPVSLMDAMAASGVDMLTLANNHALDYYSQGLFATMDNLKARGLSFIGAARSREEADQPVIRKIGGIRVGFLDYTNGTNGMERHIKKSVLSYCIRYAGRADFAGDVKRLRAAGAEVVVAYMHWGTEYMRRSDYVQRKLARRLAEAGADVIIGSHPHVVQPAEWIEVKRKDGTTGCSLCLYSLGNFLSNQPERYRDSGVVFDFTIREVTPGRFEIVSPRYIPTYYWRRSVGGGRYEIHVLPMGQWLVDPPERMDRGTYKRLRREWRDVVRLMGDDVAQPAVR